MLFFFLLFTYHILCNEISFIRQIRKYVLYLMGTCSSCVRIYWSLFFFFFLACNLQKPGIRGKMKLCKKLTTRRYFCSGIWSKICPSLLKNEPVTRKSSYFVICRRLQCWNNNKTLPQAGVERLFELLLTILSNELRPTIHFFQSDWVITQCIRSVVLLTVSYTHLTLPTIYSV